jgi:hypothetical protein
LGGLPAWLALGLVWGLSLSLLPFPWLSFALFPLSALSAFVLTLGRPRGRRVFLAALAFFLALGLFREGLGLLFPDEGEFWPLRLGCFMFLGLHLFLAWTPLSLARAAHSFLRPLLGWRVAAIACVSVMAFSKALPFLLSDASELRKSLARRCPGLPFLRRLSLMGGALVRLSLRRSGDLSRALVQRQGSIIPGGPG